MKYTVQAKHWSGGWELHVDGIGVTQSRVLANARQQAADLIESYTDAPVDIDDVVIVADLGELSTEVRNARRLTVEAEDMQKKAAREARRVAKELRGLGLSVSDSAEVLGVSRGRVSQLTGTERKSSKAAKSKAAKSKAV